MANTLSSKKNKDYLILGIIFMVGFMLRIHRVGEDSFWYDEVGQVAAAIQPKITDTLSMVRGHAGAMPLDYLVTRFMTMFSLQENIIRLPSVLWGSLSIFAYYILINQINIPYKRQVALLTAFLISVSPVNIQYSQEVRFYASLMFFYALAVFFLIKAIATSATRDWLAYVASSAVGVFFHPYLMLTTVIGFFFLMDLFLKRHRSELFIDIYKKNICAYVLSCVLIVILFLPGYLFFHTQDFYTYELGLSPNSILSGLGFKATISSESLPSFGVWHLFLAMGVLLGGVFVLKNSGEYFSMIFLWVSLLIQIILVIFLDYSNGYPFIPRQIIHMTPFVYLLFSIGFMELTLRFKRVAIQYAFTAVVIIGLFVSALPYINLVYDHSKGGTREIAQIIVERYRPGQKVLTLSAQHETTLRFYLSQLVGDDTANEMTLSTTEGMGTFIQSHPEILYVYLSRDTNADVRREIVRLGFEQIKIAEDTDFIFVRP
ncbi:MAG: glycosyltransferase family 39 protein [Anaerolineales bacterium]|uniref:glycosyltransferase family 39 protein n=1 Tax=Candidatus Villigracilis vicinus TaxID=3140679 RepID=UPI0031370CE8|nr:glycosyltransferase family 39 protein [Anaerolineales bacterium]